MNPIKEIIQNIIKFRDLRNWEKFHKPKDLSLALLIEASELNELFLWKQDDDSIPKDRIEEELADVFVYAFLLTEKYGFDVKDIILKKIEKNAKKYPIEKSHGNATKYNEL